MSLFKKNPLGMIPGMSNSLPSPIDSQTWQDAINQLQKERNELVRGAMQGIAQGPTRQAKRYPKQVQADDGNITLLGLLFLRLSHRVDGQVPSAVHSDGGGIEFNKFVLLHVGVPKQGDVEIVVKVIGSGRTIIMKDDRSLYPSDTLLAQLSMLE